MEENKTPQNIEQYQEHYSESGLFSKIGKVCKKAGMKVIYYVLLLYYVLMDENTPHIHFIESGFGSRESKIGIRKSGVESRESYNISSLAGKTGPSLQTRLGPWVVWMVQPIHAPKPQPIRSSILTSPWVPAACRSALIMGNGPHV